MSVRVEPDTSRFAADLRRQLRGLRPVEVRVTPDLARFDRELLRGLRGITSINIPVAPDTAFFMARLRAALAGQEVTVRVVPDLAPIHTQLVSYRPPPLQVPVEADSDSTNRLTASLSRLSGALGITARVSALTLALGLLGGAAAASAASLITFGAALAPAIGILAAAPAAVLGLQAAMGALRLATAGVGDAFETALTGSGEEFTEALEALSPAAQAAAREVRALRPEFERLRSTVQDAFFRRLEGDITRVAEALGGPLRRGLRGIAADWGTAASAAAGYLASAQGVRRVQQILTGTQRVTGALAGEVRGLVSGFVNLAGAISRAFGTRAATALGDLAGQLGDFLNRIANNGQAVAWVDDAVFTFRQLGALLGNIGSILRSVFQAANAAGGDVLGTLGHLTGEAARFLNTSEGSGALVNIFETLATVGSALGPILTELITQVGALAPAFVPIIQTLGPALTRVLAALGPALQAIMPGLQAIAGGLAQGLGALGPALRPLGAALGQALAALA
ncbi:MAG: hypothetical protein ACRDQ0_21235, partial [Pseudonocardia sp.]